MKNVFLIVIVLVIGFVSKAQTPFSTPNLLTGGATKITQNKGAGQFDSGLVVTPRFTDTASANLSVVSLYGGMLIRVLDTIWMRNESATRWNKMGGSAGSAGSYVDGIYRTPGIDSIYFTISGTTYAIKDSTDEDACDVIVDVLADITELEDYAGNALTVIVTDSLRGGIFTYYSTGLTTDNGIVFNATGKGGGYWKRDHTQANGVNACWWMSDLDSTTNKRTEIQAAIDYVYNNGGGTVYFAYQQAYTVDSLKLWASCTLAGDVGYSYSTPTNTRLNPTRLKITTTGQYIVSVEGQRKTTFKGIEFFSSGAFPYSTNVAIQGDGGTNGGLISECYFSGFDHAFDGGSGSNGYPGTLIFENCTFRTNNVGIYICRDSEIRGNTFSSNKEHAIYLNSGQTTINGNYFDFQRTNDSAANAIYLDKNCRRIQIINNKSDRDAGAFVNIRGDTDKKVFMVTIANNQIKRDGWGVNLSNANQAAIRIFKAQAISIYNNDFYASDYDAGGIEGLYSPRVALQIQDSCSNIVFKANNTFNVKHKLDLQGREDKWTWTASGSEYYLIQRDGLSDNPVIGEPDMVEFNQALLTSGTAGSLSAGQWAWGDNNSLGYNTLYVRLTGDRNPTTVGIDSIYAYYDNNVIDFDSTSTNITTDAWRDVHRIILEPAQTRTFILQTNSTGEGYTPTFDARGYILSFEARENTTTNANYSIVSVVNKRTSETSYGTTSIGAIESYISDLDFGNDAANTLQLVSISSDAFGSLLRITVKNNGVNPIKLFTTLKW